jgi:hypothetical protein
LTQLFNKTLNGSGTDQGNQVYTYADCGKASEETGKDAEVENSDYFDEDTNDLDKLR